MKIWRSMLLCGRSVRINENGAILVESAVILPLLLLLLLGTFDLTQAYRTKEGLQRYSREAAKLAYRDCLAPYLPLGLEDLAQDRAKAPLDNDALSACLERSVTKISEFRPEGVDNPRVVISAFRCGDFRCDYTEPYFSDCSCSDFGGVHSEAALEISQFWDDGQYRGYPLEDIITRRGEVVVAEVTSEFPSFDIVSPGDRAYEFAIF